MNVRRRRSGWKRRSVKFFETLERRNLLTVFLVNTTSDLRDATPLGDGIVDVDLSTPELEISLRAALEEANASEGSDRIEFAIPTNDPGYVDIDQQQLNPLADTEPDIAIIQLQTALPPILDSDTIIDGTSQAVNVGDTNPFGHEIVLSGGNLSNVHDISVLEHGELVDDVHFGNRPQTSLIKGTVWLDADANGQRNGENAIPGREIYLDLNNDNSRDEGEPRTFSDQHGLYHFLGAPVGTYVVRQILPDNWQETAPSSDTSGASVTIDVDEIAILTDIDFGSFPVPASISGLVWSDADGDGVFDVDVIEGISEDRLSGFAVFIDANENGFFEFNEPLTTTNANGVFTFDNLAPGNHRIGTRVDVGLNQTLPDPASDRFYQVFLQAGETRTDLDFGIIQNTDPLPVFFEGQVFADLNLDGVRSENEPGLPIPLTVNGSTIASDFDGSYFYSDAPGLYSVEVNVPESWNVLFPQGGIVRGTADPGATVIQDFAVDLPGGVVTGTVFVDRDGDQEFSNSESTWNNAPVYLDLNDNGDWDRGEPLTQTDFQGRYTLPTPDFGVYTVRTESREGYDPTTPQGGAHSVSVSQEARHVEADFGFRPLPVIIQGNVWFDENHDQIRDESEPVLEGVEVRATNADGSPIVAEVLPDGRYRIAITVDFPTQVTLRTASTQWLGSASLQVSPGNELDQDIAASPIAPRVRGVKWLDVNADGLRDGEDGLAGWRIYADLNMNGVFDDEAEPFATTDEVGEYSLSLPGPGNYRIAESPQSNWVQTFPSAQGNGLLIRSDRNRIQGLVIQGFEEHGVRILGGSENVIRLNEITGNDGSGVVIENSDENTATNNEVAENSIFGNGGLGIDLGNQGLDAIDPLDDDLGPNTSQNRPELSQALIGTTTRIDGELRSSPNAEFRMDVYQNDPDQGVPQGQFHIGSFMVTTDEEGVARFREPLGSGAFSINSILTATATDASGNTSEFSTGVTPEMFSRIQGTVFEDVTGDGITPDDLPIDDVTMELFEDDGDSSFNPDGDPLVRTTATADDSGYSFEDVGPGRYFVRLADDDNQTAGGDQFPDVPYYTLDLVAGQDDVGNDFANFRPVLLGGNITQDLNGDGFSEDDTPLHAAPINLWRDNGDALLTAEDELLQTFHSNETGSYQFDPVLGGTYFIAQASHEDYLQTDGGNLERDYYTVVTESGADQLTNDFANARLSVVSGQLWSDEDRDGAHNPDQEFGLADWTVSLVDTDGVAVQSVPTDAQGHYEFRGVLPGDYQIVQSRLSGYEPTYPTRRFDAATALPGGTISGFAAVGHFTEDSLADVLLVNDMEDTVHKSSSLWIYENLDFDDLLDCIPNESELNCAPAASSMELGPTTRPQSVILSDFDLDGDTDLAVAAIGLPDAPGSSGLIILRNQGDGTFIEADTWRMGHEPFALASIEVNADGFADLVVADLRSNQLVILQGNGDGTFAELNRIATEPSPTDLTVGDFNDDGIEDLAVALFESQRVSIYLADGLGQFVAAPSLHDSNGPVSVAASDVDSDGTLDLIVADFHADSVDLYHGVGDGTFLSPQSYPVAGGPQSITVEDLNGDDHLDVAVTSSDSPHLAVLYGDGSGDFADAFSFAVPASNTLAGISPQSIAVSDLNADDTSDLVVGLYVGGGAVLLNREPLHQVTLDYGLDALGRNFGNALLFGSVDVGGAAETSNAALANHWDVNRDGFLSPGDALFIVQHLNTEGEDREYLSAADVNQDGFVSPSDVLSVIHQLNEQAAELRRQAAVAAAIHALAKDDDESGKHESEPDRPQAHDVDLVMQQALQKE